MSEIFPEETVPSRVLIVKMSSIGDVIHTIPAYMALRDAWPATRFGWAVEPAAAPLLHRLPGPPSVHVLDTQQWRRRFWHPATVGKAKAALAELRASRYELAIDFQGLIKSAVVARLSRAPVLGLAKEDLREPLARRWYERTAEPADPTAHVIYRSLGLVAAAGVTPAAPRFPRMFDAEDEAFVAANLDRLGLQSFVVMHGAANWPSKRFSPRRLAAVARGIFRQTGRSVLWTWGPGEEAGALRQAMTAGEGNLPAFPTTLPQLAALLQRADLFIGGDSAPLHLAVACETPVVAIFGPTSAHRLGPLRAVDRSVVSIQPCSFCHQRHCPIGTQACLETLRADEVLHAALERLAMLAERAC